MEEFKGEMFHTARWNHNYDYSGKRMAVIGNGCSAAQVVPVVAKDVAYIKQYARSPQWYHERPNRPFTAFEKWCMRNIPLWERYLRLKQFLDNDNLVTTYLPGPLAAKQRALVENHAKEYIYATAPDKYHQILVPDFPLGCKRRIFDPDYLESLHRKNLDLVPDRIERFNESGVVSEGGKHTAFDVIVLATGFQVQQFLIPMEVTGVDNICLAEQWKENRGAQAYMGSYMHNFPNFAIL
jgi:cation diffusion facilitator CzcD-associated flavoprotein CzcO